jgi:hypothetical protein
VLTLATVPFGFVTGHTPYGLLAGLLVIRGLGLGATMMPAMAAAYATLTGPDVPRATSALNVVQRVGGSLGTAVLAVVLQHQIRSALPAGGAAAGSGGLQHLPEGLRQKVAEPLAGAFATTFWWAVGFSLVALVPAVILMRTTRRHEDEPGPPPPGEPPVEQAPAHAAV